MYGFEPFSVSDVQLWSSYTINGENNVTHTSGNKQADNVLFYHSGEMPFGQYTLSIYVGHAEDDASFFLDWIEYNTTSATASTSSSASHATQSEQGGNAVHPKSSLAVIIGGAVGGVVLLAMIGLCIFWWMKRRSSMGDKIAADLHAFDKEQGASRSFCAYLLTDMETSAKICSHRCSSPSRAHPYQCPHSQPPLLWPAPHAQAQVDPRVW